MSRMYLAASLALAGVLLAGLLVDRPARDAEPPAGGWRTEPAEPSPPPTHPAAAPEQLPPEIATILEARARIGSVVEGSSLDDRQAGDAFAESLQRVSDAAR